MTRTGSGAFERGLTLVELLLATAIGTIVFAALNSIVMLGLRTQATGSSANEQVYLADFALDRLISKTRAAPPKFLSGTSGESTGSWLAPVMFCFDDDRGRLMETTPADADCENGVALASGVTSFSAQLAASSRAVDTPVVTYSLTIARANAPQPVSVAASVRLGGGTQ